VITPVQLTPPHHKPIPRPAEPGSGFASVLAQQIAEQTIATAEPPTEEPTEPTIELKPRKARTTNPSKSGHFMRAVLPGRMKKSALRDSQEQSYV